MVYVMNYDCEIESESNYEFSSHLLFYDRMPGAHLKNVKYFLHNYVCVRGYDVLALFQVSFVLILISFDRPFERKKRT